MHRCPSFSVSSQSKVGLVPATFTLTVHLVLIDVPNITYTGQSVNDEDDSVLDTVLHDIYSQMYS